MSTATPTQTSLFDAPLPYGGVPHNSRETSVEAAKAFAPKRGTWLARVLLALLDEPATDEELEIRLGCQLTRTSRPRRRELELMGLVEDSGDRMLGIGKTSVIVWQLTAAGVEKAKEIGNDD